MPSTAVTKHDSAVKLEPHSLGKASDSDSCIRGGRNPVPPRSLKLRGSVTYYDFATELKISHCDAFDCINLNKP